MAAGDGNSMNTVKNVHSPAGMAYRLNGARLVNLKDCPKCRYGTVDLVDDNKFYLCADCGHRYPNPAKGLTK